ncbi:MAG TPA: DUF4339 domain-containing protein [Phycisphaerae bacterium]|nr:DUF4339 domain-containing protein [Phycisphaerae bacterium]
MLGVQIIIWVICGLICSAIAASKGRNVVGWFFVGLLTALIGIIIIACLSNLKEEKARLEWAESERRRLREQLRQERIKGESFRQYSAARLDAHDQALDMDTRSPAALPGAEHASPFHQLTQGPGSTAAASRAQAPESAFRNLAAQASPSAPPVQDSGVLWYYELSGQAVGPVSENDIRNLLRSGRISRQTLLWTEDLGQWTFADQVETFRREVSR